MSKKLTIFLVFFFFTFSFINNNFASIDVLCSFHPIYIFTQNVVGTSKNVNVECLLPFNIGPHDYALTPSDMKKLAKADLFIINGLGVEEFLEKAVKTNPKLKVIDTSAGIKPIATRGAEETEEGHHEKEHHHGIYNPHIWVSPKLAIIQVKNIQKALSDADPSNAKLYLANANKYIEKLNAISNELTNVSKTFKNRKIVTFHDAFDYFARDIGLEVVGVIEVVPGQEPSAGELSKLIKMVKKTKAGAIFSEPQYPEKVAVTLSKEAKVPIYQLDPSATGDGKPDTYEKIMRKNIEVLKKALGDGK